MAIDRKELINRKYDENKECVGFEYELKIEDEKVELKHYHSTSTGLPKDIGKSV